MSEKVQCVTEAGLMKILNISSRSWISEEIFVSVEAEFISTFDHISESWIDETILLPQWKLEDEKSAFQQKRD